MNETTQGNLTTQLTPPPKENPFRGSLEFKNNKWWSVQIIDPVGQILVEFFGEGNGFYFGGPVLLGSYRPMSQTCNGCRNIIDQNKFVFVVDKVRENIVATGLSTFAMRIDVEDVFCSAEKLPKFLEWQMEQHRKLSCVSNTTQPTSG